MKINNKQELKTKFNENKLAIEKAKSLNQDITPLLKTKYDLLKIGFLVLKNKTKDDKFNRNPKKYSTLISYLKNMKETAQEAKMPLDEVISLEKEIKKEMDKNNLKWLLSK